MCIESLKLFSAKISSNGTLTIIQHELSFFIGIKSIHCQEKEVVYRKLFKAALNCLVLSGKFLISQGEIVCNLDAKVIPFCFTC